MWKRAAEPLPRAPHPGRSNLPPGNPMQIDIDKWKRVAEPQRTKDWCYAASLASVSRYQVDTDIHQEDFVTFTVGVDTSERPEWGKYTAMLQRLMTTGIEYSRNPGRRKLVFDIDLEHGYSAGLVIRELTAGRPLICTIQGGAHDLVVIGAYDVDGIAAVKYWNPGDNGIGDLKQTSFEELEVVCTVAVRVTPAMEQIVFVSGGTL